MISTCQARSIERLQLDIHHVVFPFRGKYCRVCTTKLLPLATNTSSNSIMYHVRFFLGTFLVESIINVLARFRLRRLKNIFKKNRNEDLNAHSSSSQGRHLVLLIASIAHAMYFVMMGSRSGFPVMFLAYVVSAFARALLTGQRKIAFCFVLTDIHAFTLAPL